MASIVRALVSLLLAASICWCSDPEENMDTIQIIRHWGYPAERHHVTTADGYILELHRIPGDRHSSGQPTNKPVVFLQHGLEGSSAQWVTNLPEESAGFMFADAGYDVWMGNFRGNVYSKRHVTLSPHSHQFWKFSWDQMAQYDLPAMIDYALSVSGQQQLYYTAHSMGTLTAFAEFDRNSSLRQKIRRFFAMGPVGHVGHIEGLLHYVARYLHEVQWLLHVLGDDQFLPQSWLVTHLKELICGAFPDHNHLCENVYFLMCGPDSVQFNNSRIAVYVAHMPAGTSTQTVIHFGQMVRSDAFQAYDWGSPGLNREHYGSSTPPMYGLTNMDLPTYLFYGDMDWLADTTDVQSFLLPTLPNIQQHHLLHQFNHLDFVWGMRAAREVYQPILSVMNADRNQ